MVSHSSLSLLQLVYVYTSSASAYFTIIDSFIDIKSIIIINVAEMVTGRDNCLMEKIYAYGKRHSKPTCIKNQCGKLLEYVLIVIFFQARITTKSSIMLKKFMYERKMPVYNL